MTQQLINVGTGPDTKDGDTVRQAFIKVNENFTEVYGTLELLTGGGGTNQVVETSIRGSVYDNNNNLLIDATTGKLTVASIPSFIPLKFEFRANFGNNGSLDSIEDLPSGWTYTKANNLATISHNVGRQPATVSYWGYSAADGQRLRFPTAGYQVTRTTSAPYNFTLNLNSAVTGTDNGFYAIVTVLF